jgi:hypothetical protein
MDDIPVVLTVAESRPNWNLIAVFDDGMAYILGFHLSLDAALDAGYAYLHAASVSGIYGKPKNAYRLTSARPRNARHTNVALSEEAWAWFTEQTRIHKYNGRATYLGMGSFILALIAANPNPEDWIDNRHIAEPDLPEYNNARVSDNQLPVWKDDDFNDNRDYRGYRRIGRTFPSDKLEAILTRLEPIALHHKITPTYERRDLLKRKRWASATLEAIGLQYLVAKNPPIPNPVPPKRDRRHHNDATKADTRFPFF